MTANRKTILTTAAVFAAFLLSGADILLENARKGDTESQVKVANEFFFGKNRKVNLPLAYYWFRKAAANGSAHARYNMAVCLQKGWGCKKNSAGAFRNFELAMKQGIEKAAIRYAEMLYRGVDAESFEDEKIPAVKADQKKALEILRHTAQNDTESMEILAKFLYMDAEKNGVELRGVLKRYTEKSPDPAPELLLVYSACLRSGLGGVMPDAAAGAKVLEKAAAKNHPEAIAQLAEMTLMGWGMPANKNKALQLYMLAVKLGSPRAKTDVAQMKLAGVYLKHDPAGAFKLLTEAAEKKYPPALCKLGDCYAFGIGTEQNMAKAVFYYMNAAERGNRLAAFRMGEFYRDGVHLPKNPAAAFHYFSTAAKAGHAGAMREAGKALLGNSGIDPDYKRAMEYLRQAAAKGDKEAMKLLQQ